MTRTAFFRRPASLLSIVLAGATILSLAAYAHAADVRPNLETTAATQSPAEKNADAAQALLVPAGTKAQRPAHPVDGMIRYCTGGCAAVGFEVREAGAWISMGAAVSDERLKEDIAELDGKQMLDRLEKVKAYSYRRKDDDAGRVRYGVVAQQLETVFPDMVASSNDPTDMKSVFYTDLEAPLLASVKELKYENGRLASDNHNLRAELSALKARVATIEAHDYNERGAPLKIDASPSR